MTIRFYSPVVKDVQIGDSYEYEGGLLDLMRHQENGHTLEEKQADFLVVINGNVTPLSMYKHTYINEHDDVRIIIAPKGGVVKAIGNLLGGIFKVVFGLFGISQGGSGGGTRYSGTAQGERLEASAIRSNMPGNGAIVPEAFGSVRHFCYMLSEQRRVFENLKDQYVHVLLHVSIGHMHNVVPYLGSTPLSEIQGCDYWVHEPGANLAGHTAAQLWHNSPAVGGTSGGTAGIMLSADIESAHNDNPPNGYYFNGLTIERDSGTFPESWGESTEVKIIYPLNYTKNRFIDYVTDEETVYGTSVTGFFDHVDVGLITPFPESQFYGAVRSNNPDGTKTIGFTNGDAWYFDGTPDGTIVLADYSHFMTWEIESRSNVSITLKPQGGYRFMLGAQNNLGQVNFHKSVYGPWSPRIIVSPRGYKNTEVEVDIFAPNGIRRTQDDGSAGWQSVTVDIEFSDADGIVPTYTMRRVYTYATPDQLGFTERYTYPAPARCRVRVRRIGALSADPRVVDEVNWYGLRCRMPDKNSYPGWTTISVRLKSGNQLGSQSENQINIYGVRMLPVLQADGSLSGLQPTRDISSALVRIGEAGGYGVNDWHKDMIFLDQNFWKPRGEYFDFMADGPTVKTGLDIALAAGFSTLTIQDGYLKPVRDMKRTAFQQGFSPQNVLGEIMETTRHHRADDNDGYEIEYTDATTWESATVLCLPPGSLGVRLKKEKVRGVTNRVIAWRIGMQKAMSDILRRTGHSFSTEGAGLNAYYMDYVSITTSLRNWGQSFNLLDVQTANNKALLTISERIVFEDIAPPYVAAVRGFEGEIIGPFPATIIDDRTIEISNVEGEIPIPTLYKNLPDVYFGEVSKLSHGALIQTVTPEGGGLHAKIETINYDDRVYQYDDAFPAE